MNTGELPDPDPMLEVQAPVFPIELNPGGEDGAGEPLGRIEKDGHEFALGFPIDLPEPSIDGSVLTYDLGGGVRLFVSVNIDATGFIPVVELRDEEALAYFHEMLGGDPELENPADLQIQFPLRKSEALEYRLDGETIELVDAEENVHFLATAPSMWDSSAGASLVNESGETVTVDRTSWPAEGDKVVPISMGVDGQSLVITPDVDMLTSSSTVWPVYIDPPISAKSAAAWVAVRSGGYTNTMYKWGDMTSGPGQGTGYCSTTSSCNVQFYQRLAWEFTGLSVLPNLASSDIQSAGFVVNGVHSAYCTAQTTTLRRTSDVSSSNTFSGLTWHDSAGTRTEYHRSTCSPTNMGNKRFDAKVLAQWGATNDQTTLRMGLRVNEASITYWKRFRHDATFSMVYNRAPLTPTSPQVLVDDATFACHTSVAAGTTPPTVATVNPTVSAILTDPDGQNVRPSFEVVAVEGSPTSGWEVKSTPVKWALTNGTAITSTQRATAVVPTSAGLTNGSTYAFRARATDVVVVSTSTGNPTAETARSSAWTGWCLFKVDTSKPAMPNVTPVRVNGPQIFGPIEIEAVYERNMVRGGIGLSGTFLIDRGASTDVNRFEVSLNDGPIVLRPAPSGTSTYHFTPEESGEYVLRVSSLDGAGNRSDFREFRFYVGDPLEDAVWILDEGVGASAAQSFGTEANPLVLSGVTWSAGPHALFRSREGDSSLLFDGLNDSAVSERTVLDTTKSFVVSAHVLLDSGFADPGVATALSQDAVAESAFRLQYAAPCPTGGDGCWTFVLNSDTSGQSPVTVTSPVPVTKGEWTHLLAFYNAPTSPLVPRSVELWACTIGTPEDPDPARPVGSSVAVPESFGPMSSTGGLALGRALTSGANTAWWPGQIDNVRIFTGEVVDRAKIRRLCQGAEATDFSVGEVALDPTVSEQGQ